MKEYEEKTEAVETEEARTPFPWGMALFVGVGIAFCLYLIIQKTPCPTLHAEKALADASHWQIKSDGNQFALIFEGRSEWDRFNTCSAAFDRRNVLTNKFAFQAAHHDCAEHRAKDKAGRETDSWTVIPEADCK